MRVSFLICYFFLALYVFIWLLHAGITNPDPAAPLPPLQSLLWSVLATSIYAFAGTFRIQQQQLPGPPQLVCAS